MEAVAVALVGSFTAIVVALIQIKVHRDNRRDHGANAELLGEIRDDVRDVKADVRTLKFEGVLTNERLRRLEEPK